MYHMPKGGGCKQDVLCALVGIAFVTMEDAVASKSGRPFVMVCHIILVGQEQEPDAPQSLQQSAQVSTCWGTKSSPCPLVYDST